MEPAESALDPWMWTFGLACLAFALGFIVRAIWKEW